MRFLAFSLVLALAGIAQAQVKPIPVDPLSKASDAHPPLGVVKLECEVLRVVDGDTFEATIFLPWASSHLAIVRALDYDAPESSKRRPSVEVSDEEVKKGKAAARALQEVFDMGTVYVEPQGRGGQDVYGRLLARLWVKTTEGELINVADWMKSKGHVRPAKVEQGKPPAKPKAVGPLPKPGSQGSRAAKRLQQLASQPQGIVAPPGGGFAGFEAQCQKTRAAQMAMSRR